MHVYEQTVSCKVRYCTGFIQCTPTSTALESRPKYTGLWYRNKWSLSQLHQPIWNFQMLYFTPSRPRKTRIEKSCEQCRAVTGGHKLKSVLQPGFPLVCKLAVSNEFWEAALLQGCSLAAGPSHAPPSTLPSQICPDVPSLSGAAPGGSAIACSTCPLPFSGPKPAEPCKSLPLQTWWPQMGLTDRRPWMLGHQSSDITFYWW